ncbi:MAG: hypothetical protein ACPGXK_09690 [Phycisphaerae bacterium]
MKRAFQQIVVLGLICGVIPSVAMAQGVVSMEVVSINGDTSGLPSADVEASVGDIVEIEVYLEGFSPDILGGYQIVVNTGDGGGVPLEPAQTACASNTDCPNSAQCGNDGFCACVEAFQIDDSRSDWVFFNRVTIDSGSCSSADTVAFGSLIFGAGVIDSGATFYLGSFSLQIPEGAGGTYTLAFDLDEALPTTLLDSVGSALGVDASATLSISTGDVPTCTNDIVVSEPANCEVDASQPHDVDDANATVGLQTYRITINDGCEPTLGEFTVTQLPFSILNPFPPTIDSITLVEGSTYDFALSGIINTGLYTCIGLISNPAERTCIGYLPGDVNKSAVADGEDIRAWIDAIEGTEPRPAWATDLNRDGETGPEDLLRELDLLNGAAAFDVWFDESINFGCDSE